MKSGVYRVLHHDLFSAWRPRSCDRYCTSFSTIFVFIDSVGRLSLLSLDKFDTLRKAYHFTPYNYPFYTNKLFSQGCTTVLASLGTFFMCRFIVPAPIPGNKMLRNVWGLKMLYVVSVVI